MLGKFRIFIIERAAGGGLVKTRAIKPEKCGLERLGNKKYCPNGAIDWAWGELLPPSRSALVDFPKGDHKLWVIDGTMVWVKVVFIKDAVAIIALYGF